MQVIYPRCCGIDVHKKLIVACVLIRPEHGPIHQEIRSFGSTISELMRLAEWVQANGCTHVAMESTGVYWKPVFHVLEPFVEQVMIVNAQHIKALPGRKTDVQDAHWIADLLQHGLLRASFLPPRPQRDLRDLTRALKSLVEDRNRVVNRVHKVLEDTNIKLASVVSDITGKSARQMLHALLDGETDREAIASLGRGKLREKQPQLVAALEGRLRDHHRFLLRQLFKQLDELDAQIATFELEIETRIAGSPDPLEPSEEDAQETEGASSPPVEPGQEYEGYADLATRLDGIPGISRRLAHMLLAEIGPSVERFATDAHLASWAGLCPGNKVSAGKRLGGKTTKGNPSLRSGLVQAAQAAARGKDTFFSMLYHRLVVRLGHKKTIVALAHRMLVIIYHMIKEGTPYQEYGDQKREEHARRTHEATKRKAIAVLQADGFQILEPQIA